jgi:antitoxin component YwqK of YwqJK toxin-antitoxin module
MVYDEIKGWVISHGVTVNYVGQTEDGKPDGWGQGVYLDGKIYLGEWKEGKMHGKGKEFYPDEILEFEGEFKDGLRDGHGKAYLADGRLAYEGEWKKGEHAGDKSDQTNWA